MAKVTIFIGALLIVLGVGAWLGTGRESITAMIPAFIGVPILLLGAAALKESLRKHMMHIAMVLALVGLVGTLVRPVRLIIAGEFTFGTPAAVQGITAALLLVLLVLGIKSFIDARRTGAG